MNGRMTIMACITGFLLDCIFGDPVWMYHPIRVIGNLISVLEKGLRKLLCSQIPASEQEKKKQKRSSGRWNFMDSDSFIIISCTGGILICCRKGSSGSTVSFWKPSGVTRYLRRGVL